MAAKKKSKRSARTARKRQNIEVSFLCGANAPPKKTVPSTMTVAQARIAYQLELNIPDGAVAMIGGVAVAETRTLKNGETLEFSKQGGVKGA